MIDAFKVQWSRNTPAPGPFTIPDFGRNYFGAPSVIFAGERTEAVLRFAALNLPTGYALVRA